MLKYWKYVRRGLSVMAILATEIPTILEDGKVTVDEIVSMMKLICNVCNWDIEFDVPVEVKEIAVGISKL